jgi:hypothetical protein
LFRFTLLRRRPSAKETPSFEGAAVFLVTLPFWSSTLFGKAGGSLNADSPFKFLKGLLENSFGVEFFCFVDFFLAMVITLI